MHPCLSKPMSMITVIGIKFTWMARIDTIFIIFLYSRHIVITIVIVSYDSFQIIRHCRSRQEEANAMVLQAGAMLWWVPIPNNTLRRRYLPTCWPDSCIICICTCISEPLISKMLIEKEAMFPFSAPPYTWLHHTAIDPIRSSSKPRQLAIHP